LGVFCRGQCGCTGGARRGEEALTKHQLLKDFDEFHDVTEAPETEYIGYEFGKRTGSKETPETQKWIRREFMPENKMAELVKKFKGTFSKEEIKDHWTTWVLQGKSWKNMEGPVCHYVCSRCHVSTSSTALPVLSALFLGDAKQQTVLTRLPRLYHQAEIMRSQRNRDGQWKYTEGCVDPDLIRAQTQFLLRACLPSCVPACAHVL
jgi:hypothetical protein